MELADFLSRVDCYTDRASISPIWREIISDARSALARLKGEQSLTDLPDSIAGYDFVPLTDATARRWQHVERLLKQARQSAKDLVADLGDLHEDVAALLFLRQARLLEPYYALLRDIKRAHSMQTARLFYYALAIRRHVETRLSPPLDVLEIGGGAGVLARLLRRMGLVRSYTDVDIPPMLAVCGTALAADGLAVTIEEPESSAEFRLLLPDTLAAVPDASFDLAININSFPEMDREQVEVYLTQVERTARQGALLYTVNRIQTHATSDGGRWYCNPILLPYPPGQVLFHEPDPFQTFTRAFGKMPVEHSFAMTRVSTIGA
jgi:hypothetical protein